MRSNSATFPLQERRSCRLAKVCRRGPPMRGDDPSHSAHRLSAKLLPPHAPWAGLYRTAACTMSLAKRLPMFVAAALAWVAVGGCCCPMSGRFEYPCPPHENFVVPPEPSGVAARVTDDPAPEPLVDGSGEKSGGLAMPRVLAHRPRLLSPFSWWKGRHADPHVAVVQQHAAYIGPPPRFHPVPTRPVFEP
jgi:hypothetical protein